MAQSSVKDTISGLCVLAGVVAGIAWLHSALWGEREGTIKTDDCRTKITLTEDSPSTWFKQFTCTYHKTKTAKLISGYCEAVETTAGACDTVYFYDKKAPKLCTDPKFPYLGYDDMCHTDPQ
jgi:hypothetical protein